MPAPAPIARRTFLLEIASFLATAVFVQAQTPSPFPSGAWSGNVTSTSATVCVRLNTPGLRVRLAVSTNDRLTPAVFFGGETTEASSGNIASLDATGLDPDTRYYYGVEVDGVLRTETVSRGQFRTFPRGIGSFKIAFASCGDFRDPDQRAYGAIQAEQPLLFIHMGDFHYSDTNTTNPDDYRRNYDSVLGHPEQGGLYRAVPVAYMWDDHDFAGGDNSNGDSIGAAAARIAYRDYVPHYPITVTGGTVGQAFTVGRVRIIMTDLRSASNPAILPESATKTRLGTAQKAWFKQELIAARDAAFPLVIWVCPDPWIDAALVGADSWAGYATERTEIANFIKENRIKNLIVLSGDMHALAYDDGTNSDYATGGGAPLIVLHAASLTRDGNIKGGPYKAGPFPGSPQYGVLEITDNGGPTILGRFTGKRVGEGAKLTLQFNASAAAIDGTKTSGGAGSGRALINVSARGRIASPGETVTAGFVVDGLLPRRILMRAVGPSLSAFGVNNRIARPLLRLFRGPVVVASNDDWSLGDVTRLNEAFGAAGAFPFLGPTSRDAALLLNLEPGAYTLVVSGVADAVGEVLVEAYDVP